MQARPLMPRHGKVVLSVIGAATGLLLGVQPSAAAAPMGRIDPAVYNELAVAPDARAYVIVVLSPVADVAPKGPGSQRGKIAAAQNSLLATLAAADFEPAYVYENVPALTGWASFTGLQKLAGHPEVIAVGPDLRVEATLDSSVPFIRADDVHSAGITGRGITVAVLDSGIDTDHPDLSDDLASGAWHFLNQGLSQGAGAEDDNGHGTNVSGIITSGGFVASVGVAPDTDILAIKVLDAEGSGWLTDWVAGINYVVSHAGDYAHLCAINMSLGTVSLYSQCPCETASAGLQTAQAALLAAKNAGIVTFVSSGNAGSTISMSAPACLSAAVAVAAVYEANLGREPNSGTYGSGCYDATTQANQITCFSNRSPCNELAAPGRSIVAPGLGGGLSNFTGTSQAAPHCAGVAALMSQQADSTGMSLTPDQIVQIMKDTGVATVDPATTSPNPIRVDALGAIVTSPPAAVILSSASPASGYTGTSEQLVLLGDNFSVWHSVSVGAGVTVLDVDPVAAETLLVDINIEVNATPGARDIIVFDSFAADTLFFAFTVLATTRHYVAPAGGNVYPYHTPDLAAHSIADAIAAAVAGDSVLVDSTTVSGSFTVDKPVTVYGGWTDNFTYRDIATVKTQVNLSTSILLGATTGLCGIDGFLLRGGSGAVGSTPIWGSYGGGLRILYSDAMVSHCEIQNNAASTNPGFGGGGGIFAYNSTVTLQDNVIRDNVATRGGGVYLYDCDATLTGNELRDNMVAAGGSVDPTGAGLALEQCALVTLDNNVVHDNTGAKDGGGIWCHASTIGVEGGSIRHHSATTNGAGVFLSRSTATLSGIELGHNTAMFGGGGIASLDTSSVTLSDNKISWNTALLGGGLYMQGGNGYVRHNLMVGNVSSLGAGVYSSDMNGEVVGNTMDRNNGASSTGGLLFALGTVDVFNNIVVNSTGNGISCASGTVTLSYNLVWNSSAEDYSGCVPGVGSLSAAPVFADTSAADYHLALHSPAIDAGRPGFSWDDPDGSRGDMGWLGAHTLVMQQPSYPKGGVAADSGGSVQLYWDRNPEPDVVAYAIYCDSTSGFIPAIDNFVTSTADTVANLGASADTLYYRLVAVDADGYASGFSDEMQFLPGTASATPAIGSFGNRLDPSRPNPFNPRTTIPFSLARTGRVRLGIYDAAGHLVRQLVNAELAAGEHRAVWDGRDASGRVAASGQYYARLFVDGGVKSHKLVLLR